MSGGAFLLLGDHAPVAAPHRLDRPATDRRIFRVNGQPWRYKGVTAFMLAELFRQGADILPFVRLYTGLGFNTFRVLANKPPAGSYPSWVTPPLDVAVAFTRAMAAEGAYVEWTLFGSRVDASFVPSWIDAFRSEPNVLVEGVNEPGHADQYPDTSAIDALVLPRRGDLPYATGDYAWDATIRRGTYGTIHTDRAADPYETARKAKGVLEMYDSIAPIPWVGDEPGKPQDLGYQVDAFVALFAIYGLFGAGGTFHTLSGQFGQLPSDAELACAKAAVQGLDAFPADAPNQGGYVHDTADEAATGSVRTYRSGPYGVRVRPTNGSILIGV